MKKRILAVITALVMALAVLLPSMDAFAGGNIDFSAEVTVGYGDRVQLMKHAPFTIKIENKGSDFNGSVQMIIPGSYNMMYEQEISIPAGAVKTVSLTGLVSTALKNVNIRMVDKKGKVVWSDTKRVLASNDNSKINVGILSDDYSALSYMDNCRLYTFPTIATSIFEMTSDSFPSEPEALEMIDVIVISNFSTDLLTEAQLSALESWVFDGGLLIVGTGAASSKTLSKLNGGLVNVTPGLLKRITTCLGTTYMNFDYGYYAVESPDYNYFNYEEVKPEDDDEYKEEFETEYSDPEKYAVFEQIYKQQFMADYWLDDEEEWDAEVQGLFHDYVFEKYYYDRDTITVTTQEENPAQTMITASVDVLTMECNEYASNVFKTEDPTSVDGSIPYAYAMNKGDGYVVISGIDYTMNPLPKYEGSPTAFIDMVETLIGKEVYEEYDQSAYSYSYSPYSYSQQRDLSDLFDAYSSASVPPIFLYGIIIVAYIVSVFVLYLVFSKKKKTFKLWSIYSFVSVGCALLIFCLGLSTNVLFAKLSTCTFVKYENGMKMEENYSSFIGPNAKEYRVGINKEYSNSFYISDYDSYYYDDAPDYDSFDYGIRKNAESDVLIFNNRSSLEQGEFISKSAGSTTEGIVIESISSTYGLTTLRITNYTGHDLTNCVIIEHTQTYSDEMLSIGDLKNGESVETINLENKYFTIHNPISYNGSNELIINSLGSGKKERLKGVLFGSLAKDYMSFGRKKAALTYFDETYVSGNEEDSLTVIGFSDEGICKDLQKDTDVDENRTVAVYTTVSLEFFKEQLYKSQLSNANN